MFKRNNIDKVILCILILIIVLYIYYNTRIPGCMDKNAVNYNKNANLHKVDSCIYENLGCTDPSAVNYNKWANVSCVEDCLGSTNSNCEFVKNCSSTPQHICKYPVSGCNRNWSNNVNSNAVIDNNSCMTNDELLSRIVILSGGGCNGCSNKVYVKIDNEYVINGGYDGINMVILDRNIDITTNKINIRYIKHFNTAVSTQQSDEFVTFCQDFLYALDIVLIVVKGDFIGQYDDNFKQVITIEAQNIFKLLGARKYETLPNSSYILIGSLLLDYYYESVNTNRDAYYPLFNLVNIGCINIYDTKFVKKKLNIVDHKMLTTNGLETDEFIWRCALEAHSIGNDIFMIKGTDCYVVEDIVSNIIESDEIENIYDNMKEDSIFYKPVTDKFNKSKYVRSFLLNNYSAGTYEKVTSLIPSNVDGDICMINQFYQTIGNTSPENYYLIVDAFNSGYYINDRGSAYTYIYTGSSFTGLETPLETGIQSAVKIFTTKKTATRGMEVLTVESMRVPIHHFVIAFKTIFTDPTLNNPEISEYYMFSGPNTTDISKNILYKEYGNIAKDQKYPTKMSTFLIINGYMGVNLFQGNNYTDLVLRLGYGKYIITDIYIAPYYNKIKLMLQTIITDLKLFNIFVDTDGLDITYATVLKLFADNLPLNANQINAILSSIFQSLNYTNYQELADKYTRLVDGFNVKSIKSYLYANACIRFFSDQNFNNLIYTHYIKRSSYGLPYDEANNIIIPSLSKSIIVDKLGLIQIYSDLNKTIDYYELKYNELKINQNYIGVTNLTEKDNLIINPFVWSKNLPLDEDVSVIRFKSYNSINDKIDVWYFVNSYKSLYEQLRLCMFNLFNFSGDDVKKMPPYYYYLNELTNDLPNPTINITIDDFDVPIKSGKIIKLGHYNDDGTYNFEETLLINNNYNSYFYTGKTDIIYYGNNKDKDVNIFIANIIIKKELIIDDFKKTSLLGYNMNITYGMIDLIINDIHKYYQIFNGKIYDGYQTIDYKILSVVGYNKLIIYNLGLGINDLIKYNGSVDKNIYGGLIVKKKDGIIKKHIPIFQNMYWNNYQLISINNINQMIYYDDIDIYYYDQLNKEYDANLISIVNNQYTDNINKISILTNLISNVKVPCQLQIYYKPWDDEELFEQFNNYQIYSFFGQNDKTIFYSGTKMIAVNSGNWKITFEHELNNVDPITSILYIPSPDNKYVNKYDRSVYNGQIILNYLNNVLVDITEYDENFNHIYGVKKYMSDGISLESVYIDYEYKVNRWLIKMPMNLPVKKITWSRYYGFV